MTTISLVTTAGPFTPPSRQPRSGILDIATVSDDFSFAGLVGLIESYNCVGVDVDAVDCTGFKGLTKRFDPPSFSDGHMFSVQTGVRCKGFGFDPDDSRIKAAFAAMEAEGVAVGIHDTILVNGTDLTPASGPVTPVEALGILEGVGYGSYAGEPVIWLGPGVTAMLSGAQALVRTAGHLETNLGTQVAVSSGVETKSNGKLDPEQWAFVTGAVVILRSDLVSQNALDRSSNEFTVLAERLYIAAVDCLVAKVKVKVLS
jgi:hypothetical protein